jgi:enterochelin esterase family protein
MMKLPTVYLAAALCGIIPMAAAQESKPAPPPRPSRPAPLISPEVTPDGCVTFRCRAPQAKEVKVSGQFGKETVMTKDGNGTWSATIPSVRGGVYEYRFIVDGLSVIDSQNPAIKPQRWPNTSILHVPSTPAAPWDLQEIPHGVLHEHTYQSKALQTWRRLIVYTPPGKLEGPLPVLYLSHGYSDNEGSWSAHGKAHWILDSLIHEKKAVPMIIVMPDAHALPPGPGAFEDYGRANTEAFCRELTTDIIPLIESSYPASPKPEHRAFAGLSMGGHHALAVALNHSDQFAWIGAFSSAPPPAPLVESGLSNPAKINAAHKLFWIACGKEDFLYQRNNEFTALLKEKGIQFEYAETAGDHSWPVWRQYLIEFAPRLFR